MDNTVMNIMPGIGDLAPDFDAVTTTGNLNFSEYNNDSWVVFSPIQPILHRFVPLK